MKYSRLIYASIVVLLLAALRFTPALAATVDVSETVSVSTLADNAEVRLTSATTITVDADKVIKNISGDFPLTIQGSKRLIISSGGHGISVSSLHCSADLVISAKKDGLNIDQDILIENCDVSIDVKHDGIYSRHGSIEIRSGYVISACGTNYNAIVSKEGNVTIGSGAVVDAWGAKQAIDVSNGTFTSYGKVNAKAAGWAIWARQVYVRGGSVTAKACGPALTASAGDMEIDGDVEAVSTYDGANSLMAKNNLIIRSGKVYAECETNGTAVEAKDGNIELLGGSLEAHGAKYGIYSGKQIIVAGDMKVSGFWAFWSQNIIIRDPYQILAPSDGTATRNTIVDGSGQWVQNVVIGTKPLNGSVSIDTTSPVPGSYLRYKLGGDVFTLSQSGVKLTVVWQQSKDGENGWTDISMETPYVVQDRDYDSYIRVKVTADGYVGTLYSTARRVTKSSCYIDVVSPQLLLTNDQVVVANAKTSQEYIVLNSQRELSSLTESDWAKSQTPTSNGYLYLNGTKNSINYVYTRVKGNGWMFAGTDIRWASIYYGETTYTRDFQLVVTKVNGFSSPTTETSLEEESGYYYTSVSTTSDRLRVVAVPIPENATNFNGIRGSMWLMNNVSIGGTGYGQYGKIYSDFKCTEEIKEDQYYKNVYVKLTRQSNNVQIGAQYTRGYNDVAYHTARLFVADANGNVLINSLSLNGAAIVGRGEVLEGMEMTIYPKKGTLKNLTTTLSDSSSPGTAPLVSFNTTDKTVTIDATNADVGTYFYNVFNDHIGTGHFSVRVVESAVEDVVISPKAFTADPGEQYTLSALLFPSDAEGTVVWSSSNPSVATVSSKGVVTVQPEATVGATATITATVGSKSGTCKLTVGGEAFSLYVAGIQVTTQNMGKLAELVAEKSNASMQRYLEDGMEITFDGVRTLHLKNATVDVGNATAQGMTFGIDNLIVEIEGDCHVNSNNYHGIKLMRGATLTGSGSLTVSGGLCGIAYDDGKAYPVTLHIDGITVNATGKNYGIQGGANVHQNRLDIDHATVQADGGYGAIGYWYGGISLTGCTIVKPTGGIIDGEHIKSGGSIAKSVLIQSSGLKGDVNRDGKVDISDIVAVINTIAGDTTYKATSDVNDDSKTDISDIVAIINIIAGE